jgi:hypothetical protein
MWCFWNAPANRPKIRAIKGNPAPPPMAQMDETERMAISDGFAYRKMALMFPPTIACD